MKLLFSLALVATLAAGPTYAACSYPKAPDKIPDGQTATLEDMLATQKLVKQFDADISAYQTCLETEHNESLAKEPNLSEEQKAERQKILAQKQNAAADDAQAVATRFNDQVKVYQKKNKK
jgi:formiminotetrahydrofolate cyclodeaminase